jgi:hypothetical protein
MSEYLIQGLPCLGVIEELFAEAKRRAAGAGVFVGLAASPAPGVAAFEEGDPGPPVLGHRLQDPGDDFDLDFGFCLADRIVKFAFDPARGLLSFLHPAVIGSGADTRRPRRRLGVVAGP